jgi:hypothetical protein|tara:strand:- start:9692 stop:9931 length:240 start_codon:yes stop_codon:yes gene_type:complete
MAIEGPERAGSGPGVPVPSITTFVISDVGICADVTETVIKTIKIACASNRPARFISFSPVAGYGFAVPLRMGLIATELF